MLRVLATLRTVFLKRNFLRCVYLIPLTYVVLAFTYRTDQGEYDALVFLCHTG